MRVTNVSLYAGTPLEAVEAISFSLSKNDPTAQYMVREMTGLDSEELVPKFYGFSLQSKTKFYDFGMKPRDIVIRIVLNPRFKLDETYSDVRDDLYRAISTARSGLIVLHFNSGGTTVSRIFGFITKFEVPYFSQLPEVQLTIRCDDPMFRAINPVIYTAQNLAAFAVGVPIVVGDGLSTAPHGFTMQMTFVANTPTLTIQDAPTSPEWVFKVAPTGGFLTGDVLYFSSEYTNKYLYIIRGGSTIHIIDKIYPDSMWPIIFPGANTFHIVERSSFNWNNLTYYAAYWGVALELFKFIPGARPEDLQQGQVINNATSIMWTERYFDPGEFEIKAPLSSGLREFLPIGTFISHVDTLEVMFVENHQIAEGNNEDPTIIITGRSLEAYLEHRIVGMNLIRANSTMADYIRNPQFTWIQAMWIINDHIIDTTDPNDRLTNVIAVWDTSITGPGTVEERVVPRSNVHKALQDIMAIDDCGIRTIRRNAFSNDPMSSPNETRLVIYRGINRTNTVIFSWKSGDLTQAEYLWSDKNSKNSAAIIGRYVYTYVDTPGMINYNRRTVIVNADDLDGDLDTIPTGAALTAILEQMHVRGRAALDAQNRITLTRADLSMTSKYQYRKDFFVGDVIRLDGNFGQIAAMRVIEYVEIQDENGETGHPTLSVPIYYEGM